MKGPLVSIIIPAFNAEKFIESTLESVCEQTWGQWEVIVVDDGSIDNTGNIVAEYVKMDPRISLVKQSNAGCSSAKNTGLRLARGELIQYLDADDALSRDKIEEQVDALQTRPLHIAVCRTSIFKDVPGELIQELDTKFLFSTNDSMEFILNLYGANGKNGMIQPNAFMLSKELAQSIGPWDTSISPSQDEDGEYFCRAILASSGIVFTPNGINYYRKAGSSPSLSKALSHQHVSGNLLSLKLKTEHLLRKEDTMRVRRTMAYHYSDFIYAFGTFYPDLCIEAEDCLMRLGISKIPPSGGKNFRFLAGLVGFKNALRLKKILQTWTNYF